MIWTMAAASACLALTAADPPTDNNAAAIVREQIAYPRPESCATNFVKEYNDRAALVPKERQAFPILIDFQSRVQLPEDAEERGRLLTRKPGEADWEKARALATANRGALAGLRAIAGRSTEGMFLSLEDPLKRPADEAGMLLTDALLPHLGTVRTAVRLLIIDAQARWEDDDVAGAFESWATALQVSKSIEREPWLLSQLAVFACRAPICESLGRKLASRPERLDEATYTRLAGLLDDAMNSTKVRLEFERSVIQDYIGRVYCRDGEWTDEATDEGKVFLVGTIAGMMERINEIKPSKNPLVAPAARREIILYYLRDLANRRDMVGLADRVYESGRIMLERPLWEADLRELQRVLGEIRDAPDRRYVLVGVLLPAYEKAYVSQEQCRQTLAAARVVLEIARWRREHGRWPASLDDLDRAEVLDRCLDRYTGRRLLYRLIDDVPRLYSTAYDRDDDGGEPSRETPYPRGDFIGKPPAELPNGDWVLWNAERVAG